MQWDSFLSKFLTMLGIGEQFGVKGGVLSNIRMDQHLQNNNLDAVFDS